MIKKILKMLIPQKIIDMSIPYRKQWRNCMTLIKGYNQFQSIKQWKCVGPHNRPIPWYTYPSIEYFDNIDFTDKVVLEWGGGQSSLYWGNKAKKVITIESDQEWYKQILTNKLPNQDIYLKTNINCDDIHQDYAKFPTTLNIKFDVIIIDGGGVEMNNKIVDSRGYCAMETLKILNANSCDGAMIIFDNSDWHREAVKHIKDNGDMIQIDFHGFAPINDYTHTTSVLLTRNFNFKASGIGQPHYSLAGLHHHVKHEELR